MKLCLVHALSEVPQSFSLRMQNLQYRFCSVPSIQVLELCEISATRPDHHFNAYDYLVEHVYAADLMVVILDYPLGGLEMALQERCWLNKPMLLFYPVGKMAPVLIRDCVRAHRTRTLQSELEDPVQYTDDDDIVNQVVSWIQTDTFTCA